MSSRFIFPGFRHSCRVFLKENSAWGSVDGSKVEVYKGRGWLRGSPSEIIRVEEPQWGVARDKPHCAKKMSQIWRAKWKEVVVNREVQCERNFWLVWWSLSSIGGVVGLKGIVWQWLVPLRDWIRRFLLNGTCSNERTDSSFHSYPLRRLCWSPDWRDRVAMLCHSESALNCVTIDFEECPSQEEPRCYRGIERGEGMLEKCERVYRTLRSDLGRTKG